MIDKIKILLRYMKGNRLLYFCSILCVGVSSFMAFLSPLVVRFALDTLIDGQPASLPRVVEGWIDHIGGLPVLSANLWICALLLLCIHVISGLFMVLRGKWSAMASESTAKRIRDDLYDHLQRLPYDEQIKAETGDWIQRCTSDVETVRRFLAMQFVEIGRALFMLVAALFIMLSLDVRMTMISMAVIPVILAFSLLFYIKVKDAFQLADESEGRLSTVLQENLSGVRVVRAFGRQAHEIEKFEAHNLEYQTLSYRLVKLMAAFWSISDVFSLLQIGVTVVLGTVWTARGELTLGTLIVFSSYVGMLLWPIRQMGRILTDLGKTMVSLERIEQLFRKPKEDIELDAVKPPLDGDIVFSNVTFGYEKDKPVLSNVSFQIKKGQTVAILGPTGSGKSSLVHLLQRLYDYQQGSITINGVELADIDKSWLRRHVGIVLQEPFLFAKSIKDNIRLADPDAHDQDVYEVSRMAAIHDVVQSFEKGYETRVGEKGVTLSGGQKQRVAIARTLIRNCTVLIFDDSLSAVDTETDTAIRKELKKRSESVTTMIISHRITTLAEADMIFVLDAGRLVQSGTHAQLIQQQGLYQRIWNIQNALEEDLATSVHAQG